MAKLFGCAKWITEHWPLVRTSFENEAGSPWESLTTLEKGKAGAEVTGKAASLTFRQLLAPDMFYYSETGRGLVPGMKLADSEAKLWTSGFIDEQAPLLRKVDPRWGRGEPSQFDKGTHDLLGDYLRGKVTAKDLPGELRNPLVKLKSWIKDMYDNIETFTKTKGVNVDVADVTGMPKKEWDLNEDFIEPTVRLMADPNSPAVGQYGLIHMVPKEIPGKMIQQGSAEGISGTDWLRLAVPVLARKRAFDPVLKEMRAAIPNMDGLEADYTKSLINRITGKKSNLQNSVDNLWNQVRFAFGGAPLKFSPSGRLAGGLTKAFYDGTMLYNPGMALLNLTQSLNVLAKEGLMPTLRGFSQMRTSLGRELSMEKQFLGDLDRFYFNQADKGALAKGFEKFQHVGYKMFDQAENFNRGLGFHSALSRFMQENNIKSLEDFMAMRGSSTFEKGMLAGLEGANETQFLYGVVHQSPYLSTPFAKLMVGQFMTFPMRQSEFLIKNIRSGDAMFLPRYLAYTGIASGIAYYGMGLAIGNQIGGAGAVPEAMDLVRQGKTGEAIWAATAGTLEGTVGRFVTDPHSMLHGLTPFGGLLIDTVALGLSNADPDQKWAQWARSATTMIPAGLEMKRIAEAAATQFGQEGERHRASGFKEGLTIPVALSLASSKLFGLPLPGIPDRFTGTLATKETPWETVQKGIGIRSVKADMEDRVRKINSNESREAKTAITDHARMVVQSLLHGTPEEFNTAYTEAINSGAFANSKSLHQAIEGAMQGQTLTDAERIKLRAPKVVKEKLL